MKKVTRLTLILLLCCGLLMATGCNTDPTPMQNTEYKPQGDYSRFDTVFRDVEPPDQYVYRYPSDMFLRAIVAPRLDMYQGKTDVSVAVVAEKLSSVHYYSASEQSLIHESTIGGGVLSVPEQTHNPTTMEGYGFTLTRIRIKQVLLDHQGEQAEALLEQGQLGEGDIITVKEYYTYRKGENGEPEFYPADGAHWLLPKRTMQKDREYLLLLTDNNVDFVWESVLIEEKTQQLWEMQSEEDFGTLMEEEVNLYSNFRLVLEILQKYRQEQ